MDNAPASMKLGCTILSLFYFFLLIFCLMGYVLLLVYIFSPEVLLFFPYLAIKIGRLGMKFGKKLGKTKPLKPLKMGPIKIPVNVFEILKFLMYFCTVIGSFIICIVLFLLFLIQFILSVLIVVVSNPIDLADKFIEYGFLPGKKCINL